MAIFKLTDHHGPGSPAGPRARRSLIVFIGDGISPLPTTESLIWNDPSPDHMDKIGPGLGQNGMYVSDSEHGTDRDMYIHVCNS